MNAHPARCQAVLRKPAQRLRRLPRRERRAIPQHNYGFRVANQDRVSLLEQVARLVPRQAAG